MSIMNTKIQAMFFILASIALLGSSIRVDSNYNAEEQQLVQLFEQWIKKHEKLYARPEDKAHGFKNFVKNVEYVNKWSSNKEKGTHVLGLNNFADLNIDEFNKKYLRKRKEETKGDKTIKRKHESCNAPSSIDWRMHGVVSRVKEQKCGDCWAFASTGAMESINAIKNGRLISLSEQELIDCYAGEGCDGNFMELGFEWVIENGGINSESNYPYIGKDRTCDSRKAKSKIVKIDGYKKVEPNNEALLCALLKQPIGVSIATNATDFMLYTGGIYDGSCPSDPSHIDHQVLLVGYGSYDGIDYWLIKNSWGINWGQEGYMYIKRDNILPYGKCAILHEAAYPTINNASSHHHFRVITNNQELSTRVWSLWSIFTMVFVSFLNIFAYSVLF